MTYFWAFTVFQNHSNRSLFQYNFMVRGELSFSLFTDNFIMVVGNGKDVQFLAPNNSVVWPDVSIYSMCLRGT